MKNRDLHKTARTLCNKMKARGVIVIAMTDQDVQAEGWSPSGAEQAVTDSLTAGAVDLIVKTLNAAGDAATATKGRNSRLKLAR